jgi:ribosomal protein S27AE
MSSQKKWDELYEEASQEILSWRRKHKKATLTEIEDTVDAELAHMRAQMIQDLALASELANLHDMAVEERPKCAQCGQPLSANGKQTRQLVTEHEKAIDLTRSKGVCPQCGASSFPPG